MAYKPDLAQTGPLKSVGYLSREHDYPKGETSEAVFEQLVSLALLPVVGWLGDHDCDLDPCGSNQPQPELYWRGMRIPRHCSSDILVPGRTVVYIAPVLILHYLRAHQYLPPACFLDAVQNCPEPGSEEYRDAIKKIAPAHAMSTPPRMVELRCPQCQASHWEIDFDYRGAALLGQKELSYCEREYCCPHCKRTGSGYVVLQKSPPEFFLQPHEMYPMNKRDFDHWMGILRQNFPDFPRPSDAG